MNRRHNEVNKVLETIREYALKNCRLEGNTTVLEDFVDPDFKDKSPQTVDTIVKRTRRLGVLTDVLARTEEEPEYAANAIIMALRPDLFSDDDTSFFEFHFEGAEKLPLGGHMTNPQTVPDVHKAIGDYIVEVWGTDRRPFMSFKMTRDDGKQFVNIAQAVYDARHIEDLVHIVESICKGEDHLTLGVCANMLAAVCPCLRPEKIFGEQFGSIM